MRKLPKELEEPFLKIVDSRSLSDCDRGVDHKWAMLAGNARKGEWRMSNNSSVGHALPDTYFTESVGLVLLGRFCQ